MKMALVMRLKADADVAAIAGQAVTWGDRDRENPLPALTLLMVSPGRDYDHNGPTGEDEPRVQIDSYGRTDEEADALAQAVRNCLEQPAVVGSTRFEEAFLDAETTIDEGDQDGGEVLFRISQDYIFLHSPA
jgi:hypothetical protein